MYAFHIMRLCNFSIKNISSTFQRFCSLSLLFWMALPGARNVFSTLNKAKNKAQSLKTTNIHTLAPAPQRHWCYFGVTNDITKSATNRTYITLSITEPKSKSRVNILYMLKAAPAGTVDNTGWESIEPTAAAVARAPSTWQHHRIHRTSMPPPSIAIANYV